jgi:actin related protein 2/3 complex subunit 3
MPSYHSIFNRIDYALACGIPLIEINNNKTPNLDVGQLKLSKEEVNIDIIDEALMYFRANILFKNFPILGNADKLLVYITVFIQKSLDVISSCNDDYDKIKVQLKYLIDEAEWTPNLKTHFFNNLVTVKSNEINELQQYLKTLRKEVCYRLMSLLFEFDTKSLDYKYWIAFSKKKFMGYEMPTIKIK